MPDERIRQEGKLLRRSSCQLLFFFRKLIYLFTAFIASSYQFPKNVKIVDDLVSARNQLAHLMNYPSASDMKTSVANNRCLRDPQQVYEFLNDVSRNNRQKVFEELELLKEEKSRLTGEKNPQIHSWDKDFYIRQIKTKDESIFHF